VSVRPKRMSEEELARRLRAFEPPIFARTVEGRLLIDTKCVFQRQISVVAVALVTVLESS